MTDTQLARIGLRSVLVGEVFDRKLNGRQAAEQWVRQQFDDSREIESFGQDGRFSLVYGTKVYCVKIATDGWSGWQIFRHDPV